MFKNAARWKLDMIAKLPDTIPTWRKTPTNNIRVPLGIAGFPGIIKDYTPTLIPALIPKPLHTPYPHQAKALEELTANRYGLLDASTGSGKTLV